MQNRVLLVEDDDELRELLARYLTNPEFTVREAANGRDGLPRIETLRGLGYRYRVPA